MDRSSMVISSILTDRQYGQIIDMNRSSICKDRRYVQLVDMYISSIWTDRQYGQIIDMDRSSIDMDRSSIWTDPRYVQIVGMYRSSIWTVRRSTTRTDNQHFLAQIKIKVAILSHSIVKRPGVNIIKLCFLVFPYYGNFPRSSVKFQYYKTFVKS